MKLPSKQGRQGGFVILYAAFGVFLLASLILIGSERSRTFDEVSTLEFNVQGQARQVAESGLVDAISWMRRQPNQPVTDFAPQRDLAADPPVDETEDPAVGLVRSFEIAPGIWAQYVVRKGRPAETFTDSNGNGYYDEGEVFQDLDGNGRRSLAFGARDISDRELGLANGTVWHLESEGRIYRRPRADRPLGEEPNRQLAMVRLATQVRRHPIGLPASAAILSGNAKKTELSEGLVTSPVLGIAHRKGTGKPKVGGKGKIDAPTKTATVPGWDAGLDKKREKEKVFLTAEDVFGVDMDTLKSMADVVAGGFVPKDKKKKIKKDRAPTTIPEDSLVVMTPWTDKPNKKKGKIKFDKKSPLRGRGILVIDGEVEIKKNAFAEFTGILFVTGKLKIEKNTKIVGTVIAGSEVKVKGQDAKKSGIPIIEHEPPVVSYMLNKLNQYRRTRGTFTPAPQYPDERPREDLLLRQRFSPVEEGSSSYTGTTSATGGAPQPLDGAGNVTKAP